MYLDCNSNIVVKTVDTCFGSGNDFFNKENFAEVLESVNSRIRKKRSMLFEEVRNEVNEKKYINNVDSVTYERSVILTNGNEFHVYPVYRQILPKEYPDSHYQDHKQLKVKGYFGHGRPDLYKKEPHSELNK